MDCVNTSGQFIVSFQLIKPGAFRTFRTSKRDPPGSSHAVLPASLPGIRPLQSYRAAARGSSPPSRGSGSSPPPLRKLGPRETAEVVPIAASLPDRGVGLDMCLFTSYVLALYLCCRCSCCCLSLSYVHLSRSPPPPRLLSPMFRGKTMLLVHRHLVLSSED